MSIGLGWTRRLLILGVVSGIVALTVAHGTDTVRIVAADIRTDAACGVMAPGSIVEPEAFTPYEDRRTGGPAAPIMSAGRPAGSADLSATASDGQELRWIVGGPEGSSYRYYLDRPLAVTMTPDEFWAAGGTQFDTDPRAGDPFWMVVMGQFPDRVTAVEVGPYAGIVVWADPNIDGLRTHNVYWSDEQHDYGLITRGSAETAVQLARGFACGG